MTQRIAIMLADGVTAQDVERALVYTGLTLSSTVTPNVFTIDHVKQRLPLTAYDFTLPAMLRREAD
jgi:hypothetical protein